ncbi:hypothetical protein AYO47_02700 [Planctomyces sp. SCGC AG-212-M04]|nr:hypothetical protein AYO47_02700 [Planctomyces sp. SCGC AG-212-M04]
MRWRTKCLQFRSGCPAIGEWPNAKQGVGWSSRVDAARERSPLVSKADESSQPSVSRRSNAAVAA